LADLIGWRELAACAAICAGCVVWALTGPRLGEDERLALQISAAAFASETENPTP
jgi:hypothetical protein